MEGVFLFSFLFSGHGFEIFFLEHGNTFEAERAESITLLFVVKEEVLGCEERFIRYPFLCGFTGVEGEVEVCTCIHAYMYVCVHVYAHTKPTQPPAFNSIFLHHTRTLCSERVVEFPSLPK